MTKAVKSARTAAPANTKLKKLQRELAVHRALAENSPVNILMADTNLDITYINAAGLRTLKALERFLPCKADDVLGKNVAVFHQDPSHQRRILSNDRNLPKRSIIQIGDQKVDLLVTPVYDDSGEYLGPMVTWEIVTQKLDMEAKIDDYQRQIAAISAVQAVIEFKLDGTIVDANENFCKAMGYRIEEIRGQHHRMFADEAYAHSPEYKAFWEKLNRGESDEGRYLRLGKGGKHVWIQARYSALCDETGKPYKVIKYANDVTEQVRLEQAQKDNAARERAAQEDLKRKVDELLVVVNAAAAGDLTNDASFVSEDAMGKLADGFRKMMKDLRQIIGQVVEGSAQFAEGSQVIAEGAQRLAGGAQTQSASVEEMSASIEELTRSIEAVKDNAGEADKLATQTNKMAEEGGQAVQKSVEAMDLIKNSSEQISEIIQVISEIASQTNLLALNAAIEAARAGEHGLGFAVVADEVRKLAERSSEAAKEISKLIKESTQRVSDGARLSEETGRALEKIIQGVEATTCKIGEIATATIEQAQNANEVANAIQQISQVTEHAAAASEEMASSSEELGAQAGALRDLVKRFKVN